MDRMQKLKMLLCIMWGLNTFSFAVETGEALGEIKLIAKENDKFKQDIDRERQKLATEVTELYELDEISYAEWTELIEDIKSKSINELFFKYVKTEEQKQVVAYLKNAGLSTAFTFASILMLEYNRKDYVAIKKINTINLENIKLALEGVVEIRYSAGAIKEEVYKQIKNDLQNMSLAEIYCKCLGLKYVNLQDVEFKLKYMEARKNKSVVKRIMSSIENSKLNTTQIQQGDE